MFQISVKSIMVIVMSMPSVHVIRQRTKLSALVNLAMLILVQNHGSFVHVCIYFYYSYFLLKYSSFAFLFHSICLAICEVKNGGCHANATCSYSATNNVITCTCKTGFTNTGSATNVTCTGKIHVCKMF